MKNASKNITKYKNRKSDKNTSMNPDEQKETMQK